MSFPGDKYTAYYDSDRLGASSVTPRATLGYFDGADFVEVVAAADMVELESPAGTPTAIYAREFDLPSPAPAFGKWAVIMLANISSVDRHFVEPFEMELNFGQRPAGDFGGSDLTLFGPYVLHNIRQMRRTLDRVQITQQLLDQVSRDSIIAVISSQLVKTGETPTFTFTIIDQEIGRPLNLEGATIRFIAEEETTMIGAWDEPCQIIDEVEGRCESTLPALVTGTDGRYNGQVEVTLPDATIKKSQIFVVTIDPSVVPPP